MKRIFTAITLLASAATLFAADLAFDFTQGLPQEISVADYSGAQIDPAYYYTSRYDFQTGWYLQPVTADDCSVKEGVNSMVTLSRLADGTTPDAWLILPEFEADANACLYWEAKSIHFSARNSYDIMISEGSADRADFKLLNHIQDEEYFYTPRCISLSQYAGKKIRIAFVNNDPKGYMLSIGRVALGNPEWGLKAERSGHIFFGANDEKTIEFKVANFGIDSDLKILSIVDSENPENVLGSLDIEAMPVVGEHSFYNVPFSAEVGTALKYNLVATLDDGSTRTLLSDWLNVSYFRRRALLEKASGTWCNNCPRVMYATHLMQHRLGIDGIFAETHISNRIDQNSCDAYLQPISYCPNIGGDYPAVSINHGSKLANTKAFELGIYEPAMKEECTADVAVKVNEFDGKHLDVTATVISAIDIDNSADAYRVAFILGDAHVTLTADEFPQKNQGLPNTTLYYGEVNFLPTTFPRDITVFHNITRATSENGGAGIPGSLPAEIKAGEHYQVKWTLELPENVTDPDNMQLTAMFLKFEKNAGKNPSPVFNACAVKPARPELPDPSGIDSIIESAPVDSAPVYYNMQGVRVERPAGGLYIRVEGGKATKVIIR